MNRNTKMVKRPFRSLICLVTLWSFLFNALGANILVESAMAVSPGLPAPNFSVQDMQIPLSFGEIKDRVQGTGDNTVIHIQDAHCNYSAQHSIASIIDHLSDSYKVDLVMLEGGKGNYDLSVFTKIEDPNIRKRVSNYFVKEGRVSGAEFFAINNPAETKLFGIENEKLYMSNLNAYKKSLQHKEEADKYLSLLTHIINNFKRKIYSPGLAELDETIKAYREKDLDLKEYVKTLTDKAKVSGIEKTSFSNITSLTEILKQEDGIDFKEANTERSILIGKLESKLSRLEMERLVKVTIDFKKENITSEDFYGYLFKKARFANVDFASLPNVVKYSEYVKKYESIDKVKLFKEIRTLESALMKSLLKTDDQKTLFTLDKNLQIMKNMFSVALIKEDYDYYRANKAGFNTQNFLNFFQHHSLTNCHSRPLYCHSRESGNIDNITKLDSFRKNMEKFYAYSLKRDNAFIKNMESKLKKENKNVTILVTGGFHTDNLKSMFKNKGYSYIEVMPRMDTIDTENPYFHLLSGGKSRMETMVETSILNSNITPRHVLSEMGITGTQSGKNLLELSVDVRTALETDAKKGIVLMVPGGYLRLTHEKPDSEFYEKIGEIDDKMVYAAREENETYDPNFENAVIVEFDCDKLTYNGHQAVQDLLFRMAHTRAPKQTYDGLEAHSLNDLLEDGTNLRNIMVDKIGEKNVTKLKKICDEQFGISTRFINVITGKNESKIPWLIGSYRDTYGVNVTYTRNTQKFIESLFHELDLAANPGTLGKKELQDALDEYDIKLETWIEKGWIKKVNEYKVKITNLEAILKEGLKNIKQSKKEEIKNMLKHPDVKLKHIRKDPKLTEAVAKDVLDKIEKRFFSKQSDTAKMSKKGEAAHDDFRMAVMPRKFKQFFSKKAQGLTGNEAMGKIALNLLEQMAGNSGNASLPMMTIRNGIVTKYVSNSRHIRFVEQTLTQLGMNDQLASGALLYYIHTTEKMRGVDLGSKQGVTKFLLNLTRSLSKQEQKKAQQFAMPTQEDRARELQAKKLVGTIALKILEKMSQGDGHVFLPFIEIRDGKIVQMIYDKSAVDAFKSTLKELKLDTSYAEGVADEFNLSVKNRGKTLTVNDPQDVKAFLLELVSVLSQEEKEQAKAFVSGADSKAKAQAQEGPVSMGKIALNLLEQMAGNSGNAYLSMMTIQNGIVTRYISSGGHVKFVEQTLTQLGMNDQLASAALAYYINVANRMGGVDFRSKQGVTKFLLNLTQSLSEQEQKKAREFTIPTQEDRTRELQAKKLVGTIALKILEKMSQSGGHVFLPFIEIRDGKIVQMIYDKRAIRAFRSTLTELQLDASFAEEVAGAFENMIMEYEFLITVDDPQSVMHFLKYLANILSNGEKDDATDSMDTSASLEPEVVNAFKVLGLEYGVATEKDIRPAFSKKAFAAHSGTSKNASSQALVDTINARNICRNYFKNRSRDDFHMAEMPSFPFDKSPVVINRTKALNVDYDTYDKEQVAKTLKETLRSEWERIEPRLGVGTTATLIFPDGKKFNVKFSKEFGYDELLFEILNPATTFVENRVGGLGYLASGYIDMSTDDSDHSDFVTAEMPEEEITAIYHEHEEAIDAYIKNALEFTSKYERHENAVDAYIKSIREPVLKIENVEVETKTGTKPVKNMKCCLVNVDRIMSDASTPEKVKLELRSMEFNIEANVIDEATGKEQNLNCALRGDKLLAILVKAEDFSKIKAIRQGIRIILPSSVMPVDVDNTMIRDYAQGSSDRGDFSTSQMPEVPVMTGDVASGIHIDGKLQPLSLDSDAKEKEIKKALHDLLEQAFKASAQDLFDGKPAMISLPINSEVSGVSIEEFSGYMREVQGVRVEADKKSVEFNVGNITYYIFEDNESGRNKLLGRLEDKQFKWKASDDEMKRRSIVYSFAKEIPGITDKAFTVYLEGEIKQGKFRTPTPLVKCIAASIKVFNLFDLTRPDRKGVVENDITFARKDAVKGIISISGLSISEMKDMAEDLIEKVKKVGLFALSGKLFIKIRPVDWNDLIRLHKMEREVMRAV